MTIWSEFAEANLGAGTQEDSQTVHGLGAVGDGKLNGLRRLVRAQLRDRSLRMVQPGSGVAGGVSQLICGPSIA